MSKLMKREKAEMIEERIESLSFANRLLNVLNYYGKIDHAHVSRKNDKETRNQMVIPLFEMNVLEADAAGSYNEYLEENFERVWENILADEEPIRKLHNTLKRLPEEKRSMKLYLTNYCPEYFQGESLGLVIRY